MKTRVFSLLVVLLLVSCQNKKDRNLVTAEVLLKLADTLELKQAEYDDLIDSVNTINKKSDIFYRKIHLLKKKLTALENENRLLIKENNEFLKKTIIPDVNKEERAIQGLVFKMHESWANLVHTGDVKEVLQYFHENLLVSKVSINTDDTASVSSLSRQDFKTYLEETIVNNRGTSIEFADVDFLDIEIKDTIYFNVTYKCLMGSYKNDRLEDTNSLLVTITGKKIDSFWGIASYSWVNFKYGK
jgi:hypothetical protein